MSGPASRGEAVLVSSGGFRVDRKRALEKLMQFQLPDARMYLLSWIQTAVAGKAAKIALKETSEGFTIRFDGEPWSESDIRDPYSAFFHRAPGWQGARASSFAVGLLSVLRLKPRQVELRSGKLRLIVSSVTEERVEPRGGAGTDNVIVVPSVGRTELDFVRSRCEWCPAEITIQGRRLEPPIVEGPQLEFKGAAKHGRVWLDPKGGAESSVQLLVHGVRVGEHATTLSMAQVGAVLHDDGLKLDISSTRVVKDARLKHGIMAVGRQARVLLGRSIEEAAANAAKVGALMSEQGASDWFYWEALLHRVLPDWGSKAAGEPIRRQSLIVAALRKACLARRDDLISTRRGLADKLWTAPIAYDVAYKPLTLRDIDSLKRVVGHVPYSNRGKPVVVANGTAVWAPRWADVDFLERFFPGQLRRVKAGWDEDLIDTVKILGGKMLVEQEVAFGKHSARVGISWVPRSGASRIRWLVRGRVPVTTEVDLKGLRLDAAVELAGAAKVPEAGDELHRECVKALEGQTAALYEGLLRLYRPQEETVATAVIRDHLLDFVCAREPKGKESFTAVSWSRSAQLFRDVQGRMVSFDGLRALSEQEVKPVLVSPPHPPELAHVSRGRPDRVRELFGAAKWLGGIRTIMPKGKRGAEGGETEAPPAEVRALTPEERIERLKVRLTKLASTSEGALSPDSVASIRSSTQWAVKGQPLFKTSSGWTFNLRHPLVMGLLDLGDHDAADAYLASLFFSAVNRQSGHVSDAQDIAFQTALARQALDS